MIDDVFLGTLIRNFRRQSGTTLAEVANRTGLSKGLLSRIENGHVSPSLSTLSKIADALDVHISEFFLEEGVAEVSYIQAEERERIHTDLEDVEHDFFPLIESGYGRKLFSPFLMHFEKSTFKPISNTAACDQFVYMLQGKMEYMYGKKNYTMKPGDCLYFRGEVSHGPQKLLSDKVEYLMVLSRRFSR